MTFLKNLLLCLFVLLIVSFAILFSMNPLGVKSTFLLSYILTAILVILFYWYRGKTDNTFVLPFSFLLLPFVIYFIMRFIRVLRIMSACPGGWEIFAIMIAYYYSFLFIIFTFVVSLVFELIKRFRK